MLKISAIAEIAEFRHELGTARFEHRVGVQQVGMDIVRASSSTGTQRTRSKPLQTRLIESAVKSSRIVRWAKSPNDGFAEGVLSCVT